MARRLTSSMTESSIAQRASGAATLVRNHSDMSTWYCFFPLIASCLRPA